MSPQREGKSLTLGFSPKSAATPMFSNRAVSRKAITACFYLPMTWHAVAVFLTCARIGAVHSVVFASFSFESLRDRVVALMLLSPQTEAGGAANESQHSD